MAIMTPSISSSLKKYIFHHCLYFISFVVNTYDGKAGWQGIFNLSSTSVSQICIISNSVGTGNASGKKILVKK